MTDRSRVRRSVRPFAVFGVAVPLLVLAGLYAVTSAVDVTFGILLFGLTVAASAWTLVGVSGRRLDAARPSSELHRGSTSDYGREQPAGSYVRLSTPFRLLFVLSGAVALGWLALIMG